MNEEIRVLGSLKVETLLNKNRFLLSQTHYSKSLSINSFTVLKTFNATSWNNPRCPAFHMGHNNYRIICLFELTAVHRHLLSNRSTFGIRRHEILTMPPEQKDFVVHGNDSLSGGSLFEAISRSFHPFNVPFNKERQEDTTTPRTQWQST